MAAEGGVDSRVVVLGAGISGLVAASVLIEQGAGEVVLVDSYGQVGGNHLDVAIGPYTFDVGSFIFQDDSPLLAHFPELMSSYVPIDPTWARLTPGGQVADYPFDMRVDLLDAGALEVLRTVSSAIAGRLNRRPQRNARDFAQRSLGERFLRRSGLEFYMERFCGCPSEQIDLEFATSRMQWIATETQPRAVSKRLWRALRSARPEEPDNTQLARPRAGFAELYAPVVRRLESGGARFLLDTEPRSVTREGDRFALATSVGRISADRVVSTIPVSHALALVTDDVVDLPTVTLVSLFYSFEGHRGFDASILYNFTAETGWKRLTLYSALYGVVDGREYFTVEVVRRNDADSVAAADVAFRRHMSQHGLLQGDLRLEGSHVLEHAYPVFTNGSGARARQARAVLASAGIESFGRQGGFQYQPTARVSTIQAEAALSKRRGDADKPTEPPT